jgi:hypothetical protein
MRPVYLHIRIVCFLSLPMNALVTRQRAGIQ